jgi:glutamate synthase domain-containing protein 3
MSPPDPEPTTMTPRPSAIDIPVSLIRDYQQINREVIRALDLGRSTIRLTDVEGQRLLASGLSGPWRATIEVVGNAGPELAADLDAPGLTVLCLGSAADGAGRGMRAGRLAIRGDSGDGLGSGMTGGAVIVCGKAGHRAGLRLGGGTIVLLGPVGRLLADRQRGGILFADRAEIAAGTGRGRSGGRLVPLPRQTGPTESIGPEDASAYLDALGGLPDGYGALHRPD